jgi:hypothetical protein
MKTVRTVNMHPGIGLEAHLADELREPEKLLGQGEKEKLSSLTALFKIGEQAPRLLDQANQLLRRFTSLVLLVGLPDVTPRDSIVENVLLDNLHEVLDARPSVPIQL